MSELNMWLRLAGELPPTEEVTRLLGTQPTKAKRRGEPFHPGSRDIQPVDIWSLELTDWQHGRIPTELLSQAAATLERLAPALAALDRTHMRADLYISAIRDEETGGFDLPAALIAAAGAAHLGMAVSIMCDVPDDDGDGGDDGADEGDDGGEEQPQEQASQRAILTAPTG